MAYVELYDKKGRGPILVDESDLLLVNKHTWRVFKGAGHPTGYAVSTLYGEGKKKTVLLHRVLLSPPKGMDVDHINGNSLDNRRQNLRLATRKENSRNARKHRTGSSKFKGVRWEKRHSRWTAKIKTDQGELYLGEYKIEVDAAKAYNEAATHFFGEFAYLNNIEEEYK